LRHFFASATARALAMYPVCQVLRVSLGTPSAVYGLVCNSRMAGLTHDPTAMSPVIVVVGHVSLRDCWRTGLSASVLNLANWLPVGLP